MPFNGAGVYSPPGADFPAVSGTLIQSTKFNNVINDIATALSTCIARDGQSTISANIPFNGFVITGLGSGAAARTRAANIGDAQDSAIRWGSVAGGTADALTLTLSPAITAYAPGQVFYFQAGAAPNTGAATLAINGLLAKNLRKNGVALAAGDIEASAYYRVLYDGVFHLDKVSAYEVSAAILKSVGTTKGDIVAFSAGSTPVRRGVGSDGQALAADSGQTSGVVYVDNPSRPNLLINPNWQIDQINEGALYTINGAAANGPDGWSGECIGGGGGVFKLRTLADPDNAALKCLEITCTTADVAIAAGERYTFFQAIEGYDAAALLLGTASAQDITLQFKFKCNVNGTYGVSIANSAKNRSYVGTFVVASANEAEYTVKLTLDTAGTWLYTNGVGLYLRITLAAGTNFQAAPGAWAGADNYASNAAQANFMSVNTNVAYLKRIQLISGSLVQAYKPADIRAELARAQRHYWKTWNQGTVPGTATTVGQITDAARSDALFFSNCPYPVAMRAIPTGVSYSPASGATGVVRNLGTAADVAAGFAADISMLRANHFAVGFAAINQQGSYQATFNARLS